MNISENKKYFDYYKWKNNKWKKSKNSMAFYKESNLYFFDAKIFKVPLNQPHEIYVDILNNKIIFNKEIVKMKLDGVFKQNKIEMYFLKDIFSQDVSDNKNCYIDSNYSNILEHLFIEADIDLKWSETYGAFWFKKVTDWILKENELWNHYRETNKRKGVNKFWQKYEK